MEKGDFMANKLPEKLILYRKHMGYSQLEMADKIGVNVIEYMGWENGRMICTIDQFIQLATVLNVELDDLINNERKIMLPTIKPSNDFDIPFIGKPVNEEVEQTLQVAKISVVEEKIEPVVKEVEVTKPEVEKKETKRESNKKEEDNKKMSLIAAIVAVILLVSVALIFLMNGGKKEKEFVFKPSSYGKLAVGDTFGARLDKNGTVRSYGQGVDVSKWSDVVQLSARGDVMMALSSKGEVVTVNTMLTTSSWKNIVDIAVGNRHLVGLKQNGSVECVSSVDGPCAVESWKNIVEVDAGENFTVGVTSEGKVVVAGSVNGSDAMMALTDVIAVSVGKSDVIFLHKNQTATVVSLLGTKRDVSKWTNLVQVVAGDGFVAGLNNLGKVYYDGSDEVMRIATGLWGNVSCLAANNVLIGVTFDDKMMGTGDNKYNQFITEIDVVAEKLMTPKNMAIVLDGKILRISWDKVDKCDYYDVTMNIGSGYTAKTADNYMNIDISKLEDGHEYTIDVIACSNANKGLNSDIAQIGYKYVADIKDTQAETLYTLTIKYQYETDGSMAAPIFSNSYLSGTPYSVTSPVINGYTASLPVVAGNMAMKNEELVVKYRATPLFQDTNGCATSGGTFNSQTGKCGCPEGKYEENGACKALIADVGCAASGGVWDGKTGVCGSCPADKKLSSDHLKCE